VQSFASNHKAVATPLAISILVAILVPAIVLGLDDWAISPWLLGCSAIASGVLVALVAGLLTRIDQLEHERGELVEHGVELATASEAKSRFVSNLAHELRGPLSAVIGFAELLHDGRLGPLTDRQREHLAIVLGSSQHLHRLIDDALDVSLIEADQVRIEPEPTEPAATASACVVSLSAMSEAKSIVVHIDPRPVGMVMIDPGRLRQVVLNYLSNAIKFTGIGGKVTIAAERERGGLLIEVSDTGPGIAPDDQGRVFEEFFQVPGRDCTGSGIGLAVTKLIVEAQGGEVGVRSKAGHGSTFYAWLPAPAAPVATAPRWTPVTIAPAAQPAIRMASTAAAEQKHRGPKLARL
jgi:signal transduction histidine kinase